MKTVLVILFSAVAAFAQGSQAVNVVNDPPPTPVQKLFFYDGSNNLQYICVAPQRNATTVQQRGDDALTNIVDSSNTSTVTTSSAHGLYIGARVIVSGATVDTDLNGTYTVLTVPSPTTYTFTTVSVGDSTYTESTLVITTNYPLTTDNRWAIQVLTYNSSNYLTASFWAKASVGYGLKCTDRITY